MTTRPNLYQAKADARRPRRDPAVVAMPLRVARKLTGLTLAELAELLAPHPDGRRWDVSTLSLVETGRRSPSPELLAALAEVFGRGFGDSL